MAKMRKQEPIGKTLDSGLNIDTLSCLPQRILSIQTLDEAERLFSAPLTCHNYLLHFKRLSGDICCIKCGSTNLGQIKTRKHLFQCRESECRKQFSIKVGTIFQDSPLGLGKWLLGIWYIANSSNKVSSCVLARILNVKQRSAWYLLHRVRVAIEAQDAMILRMISHLGEKQQTTKSRDYVEMLFKLRYSLREVIEIAEITKAEALRIAFELGCVSSQLMPPADMDDAGAWKCDNCGFYFVGEREADRRTPRCKHRYCSHACYGDAKRRLRDKDHCKRCNKQRGKIWGRVMTQGYCGTCYGLLLRYGFDESLVEVHELNQELKTEISNAN